MIHRLINQLPLPGTRQLVQCPGDSSHFFFAISIADPDARRHRASGFRHIHIRVSWPPQPYFLLCIFRKPRSQIYGKCCEFLVIRVCGPAMPVGDTLVKRESRCQESQCKVSTTKTRTRRSNAKDGGAMLHGRTSDVIAHPVVWRVPRGPLQRHTLSRRTPGARPCAEHKTEADIIVRTCHTYSSFWHSGWQSVVGTW